LRTKSTEEARIELQNQLGISENEVLEIEQAIIAMTVNIIDSYFENGGDDEQ